MAVRNKFGMSLGALLHVPREATGPEMGRRLFAGPLAELIPDRPAHLVERSLERCATGWANGLTLGVNLGRRAEIGNEPLTFQMYWHEAAGPTRVATPVESGERVLGLAIQQEYLENGSDPRVLAFVVDRVARVAELLSSRWGIVDPFDRLHVGGRQDPRQAAHWVHLFGADGAETARRLVEAGAVRLEGSATQTVLRLWEDPFRPPTGGQEKAFAAAVLSE